METDESGKIRKPEKERETQPPTSGSSALYRLFKSSGTIGIIAAIATMLGSVVATFSTYQGRDVADRQAMEATLQRNLAARAANEAESTRRELAKLQEANEALRKTLEKAATLGKQPRYAELSPSDRQQLGQLRADQDQLRSRFAALESALVATPEKAIAVPMLKQQIDTLQDRLRADLDGVRGEIGRLFTLTQWFIGLMFTIALGVFGLALSNLRKASEKPSQDRERSAAA